MLSILILVLYLILLLIYVLLSFFIVYHLAKYSIDPSMRTIMLSFFIIVSVGLLVSNIILFFSINWNALASNLSMP